MPVMNGGDFTTILMCVIIGLRLPISFIAVIKLGRSLNGKILVPKVQVSTDLRFTKMYIHNRRYLRRRGCLPITTTYASDSR